MMPACEYREPFFTVARDKDWAARNRINGTSMALDDSTGGHIIYASPMVHTLDTQVPRELFDKHPEYFPLINGRRKSGYVQRCLTDPNVLRITIESVEKEIDRYPG